MTLPSPIVRPMEAGELSSGRSIVAISYSIGLPGTTSATSFTVHFMPPVYATPQLYILSKPFDPALMRRYAVSSRVNLVTNDDAACAEAV